MSRSFSGRFRTVLGLARQEALRFNRDYIDTEHVLMGILREGAGSAAHVLLKHLHNFNVIWQEIEKRATRSPFPILGIQHLPFSPQVKRAIELGDNAAHEMGHEVIGTGHLLIGLMEEQEGIAAQVLTSLGIKTRNVRTLLGEMRGSGISQDISRYLEPEFCNLLKEMELVTDIQIQEAFQRQKERGGAIADILIEMGYVDKEEVLLAIGAFKGNDMDD